MAIGADALLMPAQVDPARRGRTREWLLVDLAGATPGTVEHLPRIRTVGLTGVRFSGVEFHGLRLGPDSILEDDCSGEDAAFDPSAIVLRTVLPAIALGGLDTALRLTFHHLSTRRLYGAAAADLPAIRSLLARTFVDLIDLRLPDDDRGADDLPVAGAGRALLARIVLLGSRCRARGDASAVGRARRAVLHRAKAIRGCSRNCSVT